MEYREVNLTHEEFEKEVAHWESFLSGNEDGYDHDVFSEIFNAWWDFMNDLVLMPQWDKDPEESRVDQREYMAIENLFCKKTGTKRDTFLSKSFFMFYQGWCAHENKLRKEASDAWWEAREAELAARRAAE